MIPKWSTSYCWHGCIFCVAHILVAQFMIGLTSHQLLINLGAVQERVCKCHRIDRSPLSATHELRWIGSLQIYHWISCYRVSNKELPFQTAFKCSALSSGIGSPLSAIVPGCVLGYLAQSLHTTATQLLELIVTYLVVSFFLARQGCCKATSRYSGILKIRHNARPNLFCNVFKTQNRLTSINIASRISLRRFFWVPTIYVLVEK